MSSQLLNRPSRRAPHREMRTERVTQDVYAVVHHTGAVRRPLHARLLHLPRQRLTVVLTEHTRAPQVPMFAERLRQPSREWDVTKASAFGRCHLSVPAGPADADLPVHEIHVGPLQRNHLSAPQPGLTAQQHDEMRARIEETRRFDKPLVLVEVVKCGRTL